MAPGLVWLPRLDAAVPEVLDTALAVRMAGFEALGTTLRVEVDRPPFGVPTTDDPGRSVLLAGKIAGHALLLALLVGLPCPAVLPAGDASSTPDESAPV